MLGRTHLLFGAVLAMWLVPILQPKSLPIFLAIAIPCALLPDIDHPNSTINNRLRFTRAFGILFRHRGMLHSIWPLIFGFLAISYYNGDYALAYLSGYASHLLGDAITADGVNFLHPFSRFRIQGPFETGTVAETILFTGLLLALAAQVYGMI